MYPDETGKTIAWPLGALHVKAAKDYAGILGYDALVLDVPGQPQSQQSPQAKAAWGAFLKDQSVTAFYGFSGGGYNLKHVLDYLLAHSPEELHRIDRVVVFGAPKQPEHEYMAAKYQASLTRIIQRGAMRPHDGTGGDVVFCGVEDAGIGV